MTPQIPAALAAAENNFAPTEATVRICSDRTATVNAAATGKPTGLIASRN